MSARPVSVIVCTRDRAKLLPDLIGELRSQNYDQEAIEIVVVDNCSTDNTPDVVKRLAKEPGAQIRYVAESRPGITFARNRGAETARYPYLAYIDDDCHVDEDWLTLLVQGFDLCDGVVAVGGKVEIHWHRQMEPAWFGPEIEPWLAGNQYLGSEARLLEGKEQVIECNMALTREAWETCGGFLGMEKFGSKHMAAGEVLYLLKQIGLREKNVAYVPSAVVRHHLGNRTWNWMVRRAYWQGVSDGILDHLTNRHSVFSIIGHVALDLAALGALIGHIVISYFGADRARAMSYIMRACRRIGLILCETHLAGDWDRVRLWLSTHQPAQ